MISTTNQTDIRQSDQAYYLTSYIMFNNKNSFLNSVLLEKDTNKSACSMIELLLKQKHITNIRYYWVHSKRNKN